MLPKIKIHNVFEILLSKIFNTTRLSALAHTFHYERLVGWCFKPFL